ncbi:MAG: DUF2922 domain-containing protein [Oscillospiraceae bacterium]|nr:DUF2922 domain-containing protein [Oscillospiraceae bacterium]
METMVLKLTFLNDLGDTAIVSIKDALEEPLEADVEDLMDKIIAAGFAIKGHKATKKGPAQTVKTIINDLDIQKDV